MTRRHLGRAAARDGERGQALVFVAVGMIAILGFAAFVVDIGYVMYVQRTLQASSDAAAVAGAYEITETNGTPVSTATLYSSVAGNKNARSNLPTVTMATGYPKTTCLTSTGITCVGSPAANAVVVDQQADVPLIFARLLGINSVTVSAKATASARGGIPHPLDIMIVLDTTQSMSDSDSSCASSGTGGSGSGGSHGHGGGKSPSTTKLDCAKAGVQALLSGLLPCSQDLSACGGATNGNVANPVDEVGLMVFPGLAGATDATDEYTCSGTPKPTGYNSNPIYQVIGLSSDYKTSDTSGLNTSSHMTIAAGGGTSSCNGLVVTGGEGTYFADAITAAQSSLAADTRTAQKVIILLSDGDADSSTTSKSKSTNQCHAGITAASAATGTGTWVYSIAYDASTSSSGSCSTDSPHISACSTMQQIASSSAKFYSDNTSSGGGCTSTNAYSSLTSVFQSIGEDLTTTRLVTDNTP